MLLNCRFGVYSKSPFSILNTVTRLKQLQIIFKNKKPKRQVKVL